MDFNPEILKRFFKGKYSRNDFLAVKSIFEKPEKREEIIHLLQSHWFEYNNEALPEGDDVNYVLDKIHHQINLERRHEVFSGFIRTFQRIAAILIIPLIITFIAVSYFQSNRTIESALAEIQCPLGVRTKFVLPDGTAGFLNSGSTLEYPVFFAKNRNVKLDGEAYFDVTPDKEHPFVVRTRNLSTKVLGTQFNIIAYKNENREEVVLQHGKVEVYSDRGEKLETLLPDQKLVLNTQTGQYNKDNVEALQFVSWTEGKLVFRNENMEQVVKRLARWYNVEIEIEDPELLNYAFRATFIDESLEEVLKLMARTAPITYREQKRETTNDGAYNKKKIIISLDKKRLESFK